MYIRVPTVVYSPIMSESPTVTIVASNCVGRVKWFNNKSGFGFITLCDGEHKDKDIFVHYSTLQAADTQYKYLVQGEYVEFDLIKSENEQHEFHAANVSGIKGGLLMCQTHSMNNTVPRHFLVRSKRVYGEDDNVPPNGSHPVARVGRSANSYSGVVAGNSEDISVSDSMGGFTPVVKRRSSGAPPRKRSAHAAK